MPGPNTDSSEVVANYIYSNILNQPTLKTSLNIQDVWYGDQSILPRTPAVCVAPGPKRREFQGSSFRLLNTIETYVWVYWGQYQDIQANLHSATTLAESVELAVHSDLTLGGNVIAVLCTQNEPGMINKGGWLLGARLTFESISKTIIPQQVV